MAKQRKSVLFEKGKVRLGASSLSYEIRLEVRRNTRFSLTQKKAFLRLPRGTSLRGIAEQRMQFLEWLKDTLEKRPELRFRHTLDQFEHGTVWTLGTFKVKIDLKYEERKSGSAVLANGMDQIRIAKLSLPTSLSPEEESKLISKLLFKLAARSEAPRVERALRTLNAAHFNVEVTGIKLSPTRSRWGSCSSSGKISISTLLLAAPDNVLQAVLIHELAHKIEMNHSDRFWKLVYDAMPDYKLQDSWLKKHGKELGWEQVLE